MTQCTARLRHPERPTTHPGRGRHCGLDPLVQPALDGACAYATDEFTRRLARLYDNGDMKHSDSKNSLAAGAVTAAAAPARTEL